MLHYNNPVRSPREVEAGIAAGVASWSVDCPHELNLLHAYRRAPARVKALLQEMASLHAPPSARRRLARRDTQAA